VPVAEGMGRAVGTPSLVPCEIKIERPSTFDGKHESLDNFLFEMK
jgi:hypothetical protein